MNKARVDEIKNGINKKIDSYEKLIKKKKELLDSEKDAYDFQKNITKQQKDITEIQRQLDALAWDNSSSARAKRAELQAQLAEAKAALDETYYDRSIQDQQEALDKELEDFKEQKDAELEKWDKYLEDVETIVAESLYHIQLNADEAYTALTTSADNYGVALSEDITTPWVKASEKAQEYNAIFDELEAKANEYSTTLAAFLATPWEEAKESTVYQELFDKLDGIAQEHGTTLDELLTNAWTDGKNAIDVYDNTFGNSVSSTIDQLNAIKNAWKEVTDEINNASEAFTNQASLYDSVTNGSGANGTTIVGSGSANVGSGSNGSGTNTSVSGNTSNSGNASNNNSSSNTTSNRSETEYIGVALAIWNGNYGWGTGDTRVQRLTSKGFDAKRMQALINKMGVDGYVHTGEWMRKYGITDLSKYNFNKYASGTTGVKKNQLAIIDELGEELVMHASGGKLAFLSKGSSVIPADITKNLMEIGSVGLQDMLDRNRPQITAPHIVNNEISIDCSVGNLVHIEHCDQNTLPDVEKIVNKAFEKHMQNLNNSIRRYSR